jgi:hypothetical protein
MSVYHFATQSKTARQTARDVLACVKISEVYRALGGPELRGMRGPAFWRDGDGLNVSLDDSRGVWHDFRDDTGGGILDLIVHVRGGSRVDALRWAADLAGVPLDDKPLFREDRARWARERRELERALPAARLWRHAAIAMSEEVLAVMKAVFFSGPSERINFDGLRDVTRLLSRLQRMDGPELVAEYGWWTEHHPGLTALMVRAAMAREASDRRALLAYLRLSDPRRRAA